MIYSRFFQKENIKGRVLQPGQVDHNTMRAGGKLKTKRDFTFQHVSSPKLRSIATSVSLYQQMETGAFLDTLGGHKQEALPATTGPG